MRFNNQVTTCSDFPSEAMVRIKDVRWLIHQRNWNPHDQFLGRICQTLRCWTRWLPRLWTISPGFPLKKRRSASRSRTTQKKGPVSERETNRLHDLRLHSSDWCSWHSICKSRKLHRMCKCALCTMDDASPTWAQDVCVWEACQCQVYCSRLWCDQLCNNITRVQQAVLDFADLFSVTLHDDNIQEFDTGWSSIVCVENFIRWYLGKSAQIRIRESDQVKTVLELDDMEIPQKISVPKYQKLKTMVKRSIDQKLRLRNFDARHGRIESGAVVKSGKGLIGVEGRKGFGYQWKEKGQCSKGDQCSFRHETQDRAKKPQHIAATPSEPTVSRGRSVCRGREASEAKVTMGPFFDNRADFIWRVPARDRLENIGILSSANFTKQKRVVRLETSVCFHITRLMNNQNKKATKDLLLSKKRQSDDKNALALVKSVSQIGLCTTRPRVIGFSKMQTSQGNPDAKSLGIDSKRAVHSVYATSSTCLGKERTIAWKKYKSKILITEVPALWNLRTGPMKRLKDNSDEQGMEPCQKQTQAQRKRQGYILLAGGRMGPPSCGKKRAGGKRVCGAFRSEYAYGQQERP